MSEKPGKRLVSRTEYALRKTFAISLNVSLGAWGICGALLLLEVLFYFHSLSSPEYSACVVQIIGNSDASCLSHINSVAGRWLCLISFSLLTGGTLLSLAIRKSWKTVHTLQPINIADTAALPAIETLVRPSDLPPSHQQAELLRGVVPPSSETSPEELLRANMNRIGN